VDEEIRRAERSGDKGRADRLRQRVAPEEFGLVIAVPVLPSKRAALIELVAELRGVSREEAYDLCRARVVAILKSRTRAEVDAAGAKLGAAGIQFRVSTRKNQLP
jgi:hypothetical protein